jgi:biopolymer transport protein ExbD
MITAPIMQGGVDVQLPRGEPRPIEPREGLIVSVDDEGQIFIDDDRQALSYGEFRAAFRALVNRRQPQTVYLRGDYRGSWGQVARVLSVIQGAGVEGAAIVLEDERGRR